MQGPRMPSAGPGASRRHKAKARLADAQSTVPGPQQWQSRGAGLALQDVAAVLTELADRLAPATR